MRVLVTGGGGFLGTGIVRLLLARGYSVRSYSRGAYPHLAALGVEHVAGDLSDAAAVGRAVAGCDLVFHTAAKPGVWGPYAGYYDANVRGTEYVIDACRAHGVERLVYTSSPSVVFTGKDQAGIDESAPYPSRYLYAYAQTKALAEKAMMAANDGNLATVSLRPRLIWGPGDPNILPRVVRMAKTGKLRHVGGGPHLIDSTYVDNAAEAHVQAADRLSIGAAVAGKAYFISNGEPMAADAFMNNMLGACGMPPATRRVPKPLAVGAGALCEAIWALLGRKDDPPVTRYMMLSIGATNWFDLGAAKRDLGYAPQVSMAEGFARLGAWWRAEGAALQTKG